MSNQRFYGSDNGNTKEIYQLYASTHSLTDLSGAIETGGAGNVSAFNDLTFLNYLQTNSSVFSEFLEGNISLNKLTIEATSTYYTVTLVGDKKSLTIEMNSSTQLSRNDLNTLGITAVISSSAVIGTDVITLTPTYSTWHTRHINKLYGSVNGQTKLIFKRVIGTVIYYTDSGNTTTAKVRMYDTNDLSQLCHNNDSWNATIDDVTFANTKIKEVHIFKGITQIPTGFCYGCTELLTLTLPDTITYIGQYFLDNCHKFNSPISFPNVTFIGDHFMHECDNFNQPLTIPSSVQSISTYFMYRCNSLVEPITVECPASVIAVDDHTLGTLITTVPGYSTGHTLTGTYAQEWKTKFPDSTGLVAPYRKLLIA